MNWNPCPDSDFNYFAVYKSNESGIYFGEPYFTTTGTEFSDNIAIDDVFYYVVTAFDFAGNESDYSDEANLFFKFELTLPEGWSGISTNRDPFDDNVENMFAFPDGNSDEINKEKKIYYLSNLLISFPKLNPFFRKMMKIIKPDFIYLIIFKLTAGIDFWLRSKITFRRFLHELIYHYKTK